MIKDILECAENVDVVKVIDTDSLFIKLGKCEDLKGRINKIETYINDQMKKFQEMHNMNFTDMVNMRLKNEFYLPKIIAFSKKRYIGVTYDFEKDVKKIEIRGIEGRRATTKYILDIVDHLQEYVKQDDEYIDLKTVFYDVFKKIETAYLKFDVDYIAMPINPPKDFLELKSVQSPARGMINFDVMISEVFSKMYIKGLYFPIYISEEAFSNEKLLNKCKSVIEKYKSFNSIKMEKKKKDTDESFMIRYIKDLTIPEIMMNRTTIQEIVDLGIKINFVEILRSFFKKFVLLFSPVFEFDKDFDFLSECSKIHQYVLSTYYDV